MVLDRACMGEIDLELLPLTLPGVGMFRLVPVGELALEVPSVLIKEVAVGLKVLPLARQGPCTQSTFLRASRRHRRSHSHDQCRVATATATVLSCHRQRA